MITKRHRGPQSLDLPPVRPTLKWVATVDQIMATVTGAWDRDEIERFLESSIPVRLACRTPADRPWVLSLWFRFMDDKLVCATSRQADVVRFLDHDPVVAFEISTNNYPYKGVRGNGTASIEPDADKAVLRSLLERYVGGTESAFADRLLADDREEVAIHIKPDRLYSWDFSERMAGVED